MSSSPSLTCHEDIAATLILLGEYENNSNNNKSKSEKSKRQTKGWLHKKTRRAYIHHLQVKGRSRSSSSSIDPWCSEAFPPGESSSSDFYIFGPEEQKVGRGKKRKRQDKKVFPCATAMQNSILTRFLDENGGIPPTDEQFLWLCAATKMERESVFRWFSYRNSPRYKQRVMGRTYVWRVLAPPRKKTARMEQICPRRRKATGEVTIVL